MPNAAREDRASQWANERDSSEEKIGNKRVGSAPLPNSSLFFRSPQSHSFTHSLTQSSCAAFGKESTASQATMHDIFVAKTI